MARTAEQRRAANRPGLRYPSDLADAEWALVSPMMRPTKRGGRPRTVTLRAVLNAIFDVLSTGCQGQALPKDLPPKRTVWDDFPLWQWDGTIERSTSLSANASGARPTRRLRSSIVRRRRRHNRGTTLDPSGYDAGKKTVGASATS